MAIKKVLITGGAGYVGAVLVPKLLQIGFQVKVLDWYIYGKNVFNNVPNRLNLQEIKGDIRDRKMLMRQLKGVDAVIHLAAISNDPSFELNSTLGKEVNYTASKSLVDIAKKSGVKRFIYASTSSVYGVKKEKNVSEDLSLNPLTDYSKYKALIEKYLLSKQSNDFTVLILRPATVCGYSPRMRLDLTVNMLTIQALVNHKITVFGGSQKRPNIHIQDMADIYIRSLKLPPKKINGEIFNVGYENYTVLSIAKKIKKTLGDNTISLEVLPSVDKRSYHISSKKIYQKLGFRAKHSVEEAIRDIQKAFLTGKFIEPLTNPSYYNIKMMKNSMIIPVV